MLFSVEHDSWVAILVLNGCDTSIWPRCGCEMSFLSSLMMMPWTSLCMLWYLKKRNSKSGEPQCVPWRALSDWGQNRKKSFRRPFPMERSIRMCFAGLKDSDFVMDYHTLINSSTLLMYPPLPERIKKRQMCPHFHQSREGRERQSLVSFPLRHFVMWNIAPLHHMPQQISWGTVPVTVVVNSMKASHKTAPSPWYDRNIL